MASPFSLENRVALVTGASRGLGFAMAKALKENGAHVIVNARDAAALSEAAKLIGAQAMAFDVTDAGVSRRALESIVAEHGHLDILVNNAGIQHRRPLVEWEDNDFDRVINVNLSSCFRLAQGRHPADVASKIRSDHQCGIGCCHPRPSDNPCLCRSKGWPSWPNAFNGG